MNATYPHEPRILRVTPFTEGQGKRLAAVTMRYGPVIIRGYLTEGHDGPFLSMPGRKVEQTQTWVEHASLQDKSLEEIFEKLALTQYQAVLQKQAEEPTFEPVLN